MRAMARFAQISWFAAFSFCAAAGSLDAAAPQRPATSSAAELPARIDFNRDVRPILSNNCFFCHGPDSQHREADLRLDLREAATKSHDGHAAIVPGKPELSTLVERIVSGDADLRMPPADSNKKLSTRQIAVLKQWVAEGAEYQSHWAYSPLKKPAPPQIDDAAFAVRPRTAIDQFLLAWLNKEKLQPAAEADAATLGRRVHFDLTGLPPTAEELDQFVAAYQGDKKEAAYEALVDRLLASPHFGERMTMWWLDLVRYADTVGYHGDQNVSVWPYRDYVISAFNRNLPFDQFTREQLAGDLLKDPTREQRIASGYNRLGMMTAEGGAQDKEYLAKYAADRVRNVSSVWMGATVGCAECHDHKFDPYTARDFYSLAAFFADIKEKGFYGGANSTGDWGPRLWLTTPEQEAELKKLDEEIATVKAEVDRATPDAKKKYATWEKEHRGRQVDEKSKDIPKDIRTLLRDDSGKRNQATEDKLFAFYLQLTEPKLAEQSKRIQVLNALRKKLQDAIPSTLLTEAVEPRTMRVLARGNWMDETGPIVSPAVPEFLKSASSGKAAVGEARRLSRLELADWLFEAENPLTARVFANRFWAMLFGVGLSKRLDDLGAQGEPPVHPALLDYLAAELRDGGWNVKGLLKQIVLSSAYRQSSVAVREVVDRDPYNRLYARQGRFRLPAEAVRDRALAASGLLSTALGGRSVRPYQPPGYYAQLNFPKREYQQDDGENLWRRSLYTHWQRTFLHPALVAFDAPSREECTCERVRSNTPLQSLVLLNDPEFVEAARVLAERAVRGSRDSASAKGPQPVIAAIYRLALQRSPTEDELQLLVPLFEKHRSEYASDGGAALALVDIGERPTPQDLDGAKLAAATSVARAVLNSHEFVTRD
jgi:hypothetical protein